jgi:hypothetical protein
MLDKRQRRKFEQKAAKETKAHWGLSFRDGYSVGSSAISGFSIVLVVLQFKWCSQMQRLVSACLESASNFAAQLEPLGSMLDKRQRRKFEQKAAKETKAHWGLGFRDEHSLGPSATLGFSNRSRCFRAVPKRRGPVSACRQAYACRGGR